MTKPRPLHDGPFHVICNSIEGDRLFRDDVDRRRYLGILEHVARRYGWRVLTFVLMDTHVHMIVWTSTQPLSTGMWRLNWEFAESCKDRRQPWKGHVFGGRFKALRITTDAYVKTAARYIALNPVSACMSATPESYAWSADRVLRGLDAGPGLLALEDLLGFFDGGRDGYAQFVAAPERREDQVWARAVEGAPEHRPALDDLAPDPSNEELWIAHHLWGHSQTVIAAHLGLHQTTIHRRIRAWTPDA